MGWRRLSFISHGNSLFFMEERKKKGKRKRKEKGWTKEIKRKKGKVGKNLDFFWVGIQISYPGTRGKNKGIKRGLYKPRNKNCSLILNTSSSLPLAWFFSDFMGVSNLSSWSWEPMWGQQKMYANLLEFSFSFPFLFFFFCSSFHFLISFFSFLFLFFFSSFQRPPWPYQIKLFESRVMNRNGIALLVAQVLVSRTGDVG